MTFTGFKFLSFSFGNFLVLQERVALAATSILTVILKNEKFQRQQMKLKRWRSFEKGVELGFGLRNEKDSLMEREHSGGVELGLGQIEK